MVDHQLLILTCTMLRKAEVIMVKTVTYTWDLNNPSPLTSEEHTRTEEEKEACARSAPNNPPLTDTQLAQMDHAISVRRIRAATGLSQDSFRQSLWSFHRRCSGLGTEASASRTGGDRFS